MAGAVGFEPTHTEIKTQGLTTWRRSNISDKTSLHYVPTKANTVIG